jgi:hypothetical protein
MNARRRFLASTLGLALAPFIIAAAPEPEKYRRFHRFNRVLDRWEEVQFEAIKEGDEIWIDDSNPKHCAIVLVCCGYHDDVIDCSHRIDPQTNDWVPF